MALQNIEIKTAKTQNKDLFLNDGNGLYCRIRSSGSKAWLYRYKDNAKTKWVELGLYPNLSLANARIKAHSVKANRKEGIDPAIAKKLLIENRISENERLNSRITVNDLFKRWETLDLCNRKDKGKEIKRMFHKDVLPTIGSLAVEDVKKSHITKITDLLLERKVDRMAKMVLALMRQMFRFAQDRDIIQVDPTATIRKAKIGKPEIPRDRFLTQLEITELHCKIPHANLSHSSEIGIYIALSTGCRIGELLKARWADVDLDLGTWFIPIENSKNKVAITIFLSEFTTNQFKSLLLLSKGTEWCYPNRTLNSHVSEKTITKQVTDRQLPEGGAPLKNRSKDSKALCLSGGKWVPHDLRRSAATLMTALGVLPNIADKCLNHKDQNRMQRTYQHHNYDNEKKIAWKLLGDRLELLTQSQVSNLSILKFGNTA